MGDRATLRGRRVRRSGAVVAVASVCLLGPSVSSVASSTAAAADGGWHEGACAADRGVTVVVDFGALADRTVVRCAEGAPADALAALEQVEVTVAGTDRWGRALVCRLDGLPPPDDEPCVDTPDADRSWSSWQADGADTPWRAAQEAAADRVPPPGSFEGWAFPTGPGEGRDARPPRTEASVEASGYGAAATSSVDGGSGGPGAATAAGLGGVAVVAAAAAVTARRRRGRHGG